MLGRIKSIVMYSFIVLFISFMFVNRVHRYFMSSFLVTFEYVECWYSRIEKGSKVIFNGVEIQLPNNWCIDEIDGKQLSLTNRNHYFSILSVGGPSLFPFGSTLEKHDDLINKSKAKTCVNISDFHIDTIHVYEIYTHCGEDYSFFWDMPSVRLTLLDTAFSDDELQFKRLADRELIEGIKRGKASNNSASDGGPH